MPGDSGSTGLKGDAPEFIFSSPTGHRLAHSIPMLQLPPAQLECICKAVDGINITVLTPNWLLQTGYLTVYMLLMRSEPWPQIPQ